MHVLQVIRTINAGGRLSPPPGCPRSIYELMIKCWLAMACVLPCFLFSFSPMYPANFLKKEPRENVTPNIWRNPEGSREANT